MPSDQRLDLALGAVAPRIAVYRDGVAAAAERVRGMLASTGGAEQARIELGALGATRIDVARFAELARGAPLDPSARAVIERAAAVLRKISELPDSAFVVSVLAGDRAAGCIREALARFGRAFSAVRAADRARAGKVAMSEMPAPGYAFDRWTSLERAAAPPLVVVVNGADLHAADIAELLDGSLHVAFVVEGPCSPAPLVRLITPGTFVLQTADTRGLDRFREFQGPAVAALVDASAACFIHDPGRGAAPWQRMEIWKQPTALKPVSVGGISVRQQREEAAQLTALAAQPLFSASGTGDLVPAGADDVNRLTDWLLDQSGLSGTER